jgi:hypothetical protein
MSSLSGKLMEELKYESDAIESALPSFLVEFKDRAPFWKIEDHAGEKEVKRESLCLGMSNKRVCE